MRREPLSAPGVLPLRLTTNTGFCGHLERTNQHGCWSL